ncbi:MAG: hypothetical protein RL020_486 [Pseudomonadota bacterium]|jgi:hypothetical protein
MLGKLFRLSLKFMLLVALVWLVVIVWWQVTYRMPNGTDIFLYLVMLPVALAVTFWLIKKSFQAFKNHKQNLTIPAAALGGAAAVADTKTAELERSFSLRLLASSCKTTCGDSTADLAAAATENKRPQLDAELKDNNGFPVFAGRVNDLDVETVRAELEPHIKAEQTPLDQWPAQSLRALSLLSDVLDELLDEASSHPRAAPAEPEKVGQPADLVSLRVVALVPDAWPEPLRLVISAWLKGKIESTSTWPANRLNVNLIPLRQAGEVMVLLDQLNLSVNREQRKDLNIVIACESHISEASVEVFEAQKKLFSAAEKNGLLPGEAACGLLLASAAVAADLEQDKPVEMRRVSAAKRDKSVEAAGRVSSALVIQLVEYALEAAQDEQANVCAVVSDTDHRSSRATELGAMLTAKFEALDVAADCLQVSSASGYIGAVSVLTGLAVAGEIALERNGPVLFVSADDVFDRAALVVKPVIPVETPAAPVAT